MSTLTSSTFISQNHKIEIANRKMEEMRLKNEEILKRFEEVEKDKKSYTEKFNDIDLQQQNYNRANIEDKNDLKGSPVLTIPHQQIDTTIPSVFKRFQPIQDLQPTINYPSFQDFDYERGHQQQIKAASYQRPTFIPKQQQLQQPQSQPLQQQQPQIPYFNGYSQPFQPQQFDYQNNYYQPDPTQYDLSQQFIPSHQQSHFPFVPNLTNNDNLTPRFRKKFQQQQSAPNQVFAQQQQQYQFNGQQQRYAINNNNNYRYNHKQANRSKSGNFVDSKNFYNNGNDNSIFPTFNEHQKPNRFNKHRNQYYQENLNSLEDYNLALHQEDEFEAYRLDSKPQKGTYKSMTLANGSHQQRSLNYQNNTPFNSLTNTNYRVYDASKPTPNVSNLVAKKTENEEKVTLEDTSAKTPSNSNNDTNTEAEKESQTKIVDWAAEVDRICEETRKVLEQTQDIEQELEKERLDGDLLLKLNGKNTTNLEDTDGEDLDEDLNIYKVKVDDDLVSSITETTQKEQKSEENP